MRIENDTAEILSGIRYGRTLGSPITLLINNKDWDNWKDVMASEPVSKKSPPVTIPRPGHADVTGTLKYDFDDIRNSIERSSARETAARVAAGTIARRFLEELGITIGSFVESIGGVYSSDKHIGILENDFSPYKSVSELNEAADKSDVRVLDTQQEEKIIKKIRSAKKKGDTLGGSFYVIAEGVPAGLGSFVHYDRKINAALAHAVMSINGVKGVEIGGGSKLGEQYGSSVHDEIIFADQEISRSTNHAGGIEGGITTGLPVIIRGVMKPISTLMTPLKSIDFKDMKVVESRRERSDFTAVPACAVIAEAVTAWVIADFFLQKFGGDSMSEIKSHYSSYKKRILKQIKKNF
jgi:chorismate synthase